MSLGSVIATWICFAFFPRNLFEHTELVNVLFSCTGVRNNVLPSITALNTLPGTNELIQDLLLRAVPFISSSERSSRFWLALTTLMLELGTLFTENSLLGKYNCFSVYEGPRWSTALKYVLLFQHVSSQSIGLVV